MRHDQAQVALPAVHHDNDNKLSAKKYNGSRRQPQNEDQRSKLLRKYDNALAKIGRIEADAGPALQRDLGRSKRVQAAFTAGSERKRMVMRRLGHRSGLFRVMRLELGPDPTISGRAQLYTSHMLRASANVAALTGSGWPSVRAWLQSRLPAMMGAIGLEIEAEFAVYLTNAMAELAGRISSGDPNLYTGPVPAEIAEALSLTTARLHQAKANRCGLASVDPQDRLTRDRERKERQRRKAGMKPQSERTAKAELQALADRLGCGIATIYRKRRDGTLDAFVATRDQADTEVSAVIREIDGGHFGITEPAADNDTTDAAQETPSPIEAGFNGRNITLSPGIIAGLKARFPRLVPDLRAHLEDVEVGMDRTPERNRLAVLYNRLKSKHRSVSRAATIAAKAAMPLAA